MACYVDAVCHGAKCLFRLAVKALGRHQKAADPLMRALVIVLLDPAFKSGFGLMKIGKPLLIDQFLLNPPVACFDLAKRLRMVGPGVGMIDPFGFQVFFQIG